MEREKKKEVLSKTGAKGERILELDCSASTSEEGVMGTKDTCFRMCDRHQRKGGGRHEPKEESGFISGLRGARVPLQEERTPNPSDSSLPVRDGKRGNQNEPWRRMDGGMDRSGATRSRDGNEQLPPRRTKARCPNHLLPASDLMFPADSAAQTGRGPASCRVTHRWERPDRTPQEDCPWTPPGPPPPSSINQRVCTHFGPQSQHF